MDQKVDEAKALKQRNGLFLIACARGLLPDAQQLLDYGAQPGTADKQGLTTAHFAAAHGKHAMLGFLWSKGVELDAEDPSGRTPLHLASIGGHFQCVRMLLQKGAWADAFDTGDNAPLHLAARVGRQSVVEELLEAGAKLKVRNKRGLTPLGEAVATGQRGCADVLFGAGGEIGDRPRGYSLLHVAAGAGQAASLEWVLTNDDSIDIDDAENQEGVTPLHCAALAGSLDCVRLLVEEHGADAAARSRGGRLAADLVPADSQGASAILALLRRKGAAPSGGAALAGPAPAPAPAALPSTPEEAFLAMSPGDQLRRAQRWSEDPAAAPTSAALAAFPPEAGRHVAEANKLGKAITIQKALAAMHRDEDFQQDLVRLSLPVVIDDVKLHPSHYDKHVKNPDVDRALAKLRRYTEVVRINGGGTVDIGQVAAPNAAATEAEDSKAAKELSILHASHLQAACAAARVSADGAKAAAEAARSAFRASLEELRRDPSPRPQPEARSQTGSAARAARHSQSQEEIQPAPLAGPQSDAAAATGDGLPAPGLFTWQSLWTEFKRQGRQMAFALVMVVIASLWVRSPWGPFAQQLAQAPDGAPAGGAEPELEAM